MVLGLLHEKVHITAAVYKGVRHCNNNKIKDAQLL